MLTIVNCHYEECDFYCGRKWKQYAASPLGNPFKGSDAIERYGAWLWEQIQAHNPAVLNALRIIYSNSNDREKQNKNYRLGCWCHPKPCHCSEIIAALSCPPVIAILDDQMPF